MFYRFCILCLASVMLTGCGSFLPDHKTLPGPSAVEIYQARREPLPPIQPALNALPRSMVNEPPAQTLAMEPMAVWNDAQVMKVELDAYVNEKGEAFGPSVKYVVKQPGGWNVDALRNPHRAYVPTENTPPVPSRYGYSSNPMVSPGSGYEVGTMPGQVRPLQPSLLQDLSRVRVTGFIERSQEPMARSMARGDEIPIFDEALGWILVPQATMVGASTMPVPTQPMYPQYRY